MHVTAPFPCKVILRKEAATDFCFRLKKISSWVTIWQKAKENSFLLHILYKNETQSYYLSPSMNSLVQGCLLNHRPTGQIWSPLPSCLAHESEPWGLWPHSLDPKHRVAQGLIPVHRAGQMQFRAPILAQGARWRQHNLDSGMQDLIWPAASPLIRSWRKQTAPSSLDSSTIKQTEIHHKKVAQIYTTYHYSHISGLLSCDKDICLIGLCAAINILIQEQGQHLFSSNPCMHNRQVQNNIENLRAKNIIQLIWVLPSFPTKNINLTWPEHWCDKSQIK